MSRRALVALAVAVVAGCGPADTAGSSPVLVDRKPAAGGCAVDGGAGVRLGDRCVPIAVHPGDCTRAMCAAWSPAADAEVAATATAEKSGTATVVLTDPGTGRQLTRAVFRGCGLASNVAVGGRAVYVALVCGTYGNHDLTHTVLRVDASGAIARWTAPWDARAILSFVPGERPLLFAVLNLQGTGVLDATSLRWLAGWRGMGGWFNACTRGATPSSDARYVAVPDPYASRIDFVAADDLTIAASVGVDSGMNRGPGPIAWSSTGLDVTACRLPYE